MKTRTFENQPVDVRFKISSLWAVTLFLFAYVDIFGFFRVDVLEAAMAGMVGLFRVNQWFLLFTTAYVLIPSVMIFLTLIMPPTVNRIANITVSLLYIVTFVLACIGERWAYFIAGSLVESALLLAIIGYAWRWPRQLVEGS